MSEVQAVHALNPCGPIDPESLSPPYGLNPKSLQPYAPALYRRNQTAPSGFRKGVRRGMFRVADALTRSDHF